MDGSFVKGLESFFNFAIVCIILTFLLGGYFIYTEIRQVIKKETIVETRYKPEIDYRLKAKGKKIDTVYIYKFKK